MAVTRFSAHASYDPVAHVYEQGRPDYPQEIVQTFLSDMQYAPGLVVCELGAGTGKLTKMLRVIDPAMNITAVEPSSNMCSVFTQEIPDVQILQASAQRIPLADNSVDIVMVGTAFHWFATKEALHEIARILKPGGKLGLIWNVFDTDITWVRETRDLLDTYRTAQELLCNHDALAWMKVFEDTDLFSSLNHVTYRYSFSGTERNVIQRILSTKIMGDINDDEREKLLTQIRAIVRKHTIQHIFDIPYRIEMYWGRKKL